MTLEPTLYRVDAAGRITWLNAAWSAFARANGADLPPQRILGSVLWDHIAGAETRHLYQLLMEQARAKGRTLRVPYRCDSPELRRFMLMELVPLGGDAGFEFRNRLLREERREAVPLLDQAAPRTEQRVVMCSWCKRVAVDGGWLDVEVAVQRLGLLQTTPGPRISHGICPACRLRVLSGVGA